MPTANTGAGLFVYNAAVRALGQKTRFFDPLWL
jgi:hypothetical protein